MKSIILFASMASENSRDVIDCIETHDLNAEIKIIRLDSIDSRNMIRYSPIIQIFNVPTLVMINKGKIDTKVEGKGKIIKWIANYIQDTGNFKEDDK